MLLIDQGVLDPALPDQRFQIPWAAGDADLVALARLFAGKVDRGVDVAVAHAAVIEKMQHAHQRRLARGSGDRLGPLMLAGGVGGGR